MRDVLGVLKAAILALVIVAHAVVLVLAVVFLFDSGALPGATVLLAELGLERQQAEPVPVQPTIMDVEVIDRNLAVRTQVIVTCQAIIEASGVLPSLEALGACLWEVSQQVCGQLWPEGSEPYQGCVFGKAPRPEEG